MDRKSEIESKLLSITENYKREFSNSFQRSNSVLVKMGNRYSLLSKFQSKLTDELVETANKHFAKYDIDDTSETSEFIKTCYLDFFGFASTID